MISTAKGTAALLHYNNGHSSSCAQRGIGRCHWLPRRKPMPFPNLRLHAALALVFVVVICLAVRAEPVRKIVIDGKFDDWADVPVHTDPPGNTHDTNHKLKDDKPEPVDHPDVDILEYKFTHHADNLYAYYKVRGTIGRTQIAEDGKPAGRYYA